MSKTKTNSQFISELKQINPYVIPEEDYINSHTKLLCHCTKCGHSWRTIPTNLLRGSGCPNCSNKNRMLTNEAFLTRAKEIAPSIEILEDYKGSMKKILCRCSTCSYEWETTPNSILRGKGCPRCASNQLSDGDFREKLNVINPDIEPLEPYNSIKTKLLCRCKKCNYQWSVTPEHLLRGRGCPKCNVHPLSNEEFIDRLHQINPYIEPLETYTKWNVKILCRCKNCNNEWHVRPNDLFHGRGCPVCSHSQTSVVEQLLYFSFTLVLGESNVLNRDIETIGKELDIYIPNLKLAIEFGAWYWHDDRISIDSEKERLCSSIGINLITIYEACPNSLFIKEMNNAICSSEDMSSENDYHTAKQVIHEIFDSYNLDYFIVKNSWNEIIRKAQERALKRNTSQLIQEMSLINKQIEIIGQYTGSRSPLLVRCMVCGHQWEASPTNLLRGKGCPKCASRKNGIKHRISNDEFLARFKEKNPKSNNIELMEPYKTRTDKIACRCKVCGYTWSAAPNSLLAGSGCPKCGGRLKISNQEFKARLAKANPNVQPLEEYINNKTRIRCKCKICGYEWSSYPDNLYHSRGCPKCSKDKKSRGRRKTILCVETGVVYSSIDDAKDIANISSISNCLKGKQKTAGGYHWKVID